MTGLWEEAGDKVCARSGVKGLSIDIDVEKRSVGDVVFGSAGEN